MRKQIVGSIVAAVAVVTVLGSAAPALAQAGAQIGVAVRDLTSDEVATAKLAPAGGVMVENVREGSAAHQAGLRNGDIVVDFDGERVRSVNQFTRLVREAAVGRSVKAAVMRDGARREVEITPTRSAREFPDLADLQSRIQRELQAIPRRDIDPTPQLRSGAPRGRLGLTLQPLTGQLAEHLGAKGGALVTEVAEGSAAAQAGVRAGDVIITVNGRPVRDSRDIVSAARDGKAGAALEFGVVRDRREMTIKVAIPELLTEPRSVRPV